MILVSNGSCNSGNLDVKLNDNYLKFVNKCKFLGVILDTRLSFSTHINYIVNKLSKNTGIFFKIRDNFPLSARRNFYNGLIFPFLSYNITVWGGTYPTHLNPLIILQKRFIRLMADADRLAHTTPLFHQLKILKLNDIFRYFTSVQMFKSINLGLFANEHQHFTRNRDLARPLYHRLTSTQHSFTHNGPKIWNELPYDIRSIDSLRLFKKKLKQFLLNQYSPVVN